LLVALFLLEYKFAFMGDVGMKSAIFLVTALTDVKQDGFSAKLRALLEQQVPVQILFADLNFLERTTFDQLLAA